MNYKLLRVLLIISILSITLLITGCSDKIHLGNTYKANQTMIVEYDGKEVCRDTTFINLSIDENCKLNDARMINQLPDSCPDVPINTTLNVIILFEDIQYPTLDGNTPCMEGLYNQISSTYVQNIEARSIA